MSRILYGLCGMNLGQVSRALAIARGLRARGHEVAFAGGGRAVDALRAGGARVFEVPVVRQIVDGNRLRAAASVRCNLGSFVRRGSIAWGLAQSLAAWGPDLVVSDYEPFCARAAERLGLPVVSLDHQQAVTALSYDVPPRFRLEALLTAAVIRRTVAASPVHAIVTSFFRAAVREPSRTTVVGPILRDEVLAARPSVGEHVLVYLNQGDGRAVLDVLARVGVPAVVYGGELAVAPGVYGRLAVRAGCRDGFLEELATARAVLCTAGHTLMSEALHVGKPILALPLQGTFEQTLNALALEHARFGEAVHRRALTVADVRGFLARADEHRTRLPLRAPGNDAALAILEAVLAAPAPRAGAAA